jgi:hypothetical protein
MANVKTGTMTFPASLGKLLPGADYAARSLPLTENIVPCENDGVTPDRRFNSIKVVAHPDNNGRIYICNSAAAPDTVNYTNIIDILAAGARWEMSKEWANNRDISTIFVGASNDSSFAIASIDQF